MNHRRHHKYVEEKTRAEKKTEGKLINGQFLNPSTSKLNTKASNNIMTPSTKTGKRRTMPTHMCR